jgi:hypothetical protein
MPQKMRLSTPRANAVNKTIVLAACSIALLGAGNLQCAPSPVTVTASANGSIHRYQFGKDPDSDRTAGIAVTPAGDVWIGFPWDADGRIGVLSGERFVKCTIPGLVHAEAVIWSGHTIVAGRGRPVPSNRPFGGVAAIDGVTKTVVWSLPPATAGDFGMDLINAPNGRIFAYGPGVASVAATGVTPLLKGIIRFAWGSATSAYAISIQEQGLTPHEIYRWKNGRFENFVRLDGAEGVFDTAAGTATFYNIHWQYNGASPERLSLLSEKGALHDLSDLASGELNDGVVAPNGDLWFTLQHPFHGAAEHLANVGHLNGSGRVTLSYVPTTSIEGFVRIALGPDGTLWMSDGQGFGVTSLSPTWQATH